VRQYLVAEFTQFLGELYSSREYCSIPVRTWVTFPQSLVFCTHEL
jgi:hypothetical protein